MDKKRRRENKKKDRRGALAEEVIYIFEKILDKWKTIRIYNTIIQNNKFSKISKRNVENISTGNSKVYEYELSADRYNYYLELRCKVYNFHKKYYSLSEILCEDKELFYETYEDNLFQTN